MQSENTKPLDDSESEPEQPRKVTPVSADSADKPTEDTLRPASTSSPASITGEVSNEEALPGTPATQAFSQVDESAAATRKVDTPSRAADGTTDPHGKNSVPQPDLAAHPANSPFSRPTGDSPPPATPASGSSAPPSTPAGSTPVPSTFSAYPPRPQMPTPAVPPRSQSQPTTQSEVPPKPKGLLDLYDSEELMCEVDSGDDGRFVLTSQRLIYQGRSSDGSLFSAAAVEDVTAIEFGRRPRDSRSAWWGVVGILAAIAVWQVTTNETVGAIAGAVVGGISLLLLADYWFRPAGLVLRFGTAGGSVEGPVSSKRVRAAEELAARVQQARKPQTGGRNGSSGRPPGGSPGLG